jgi:hypothetical protein
MMQLPTSPNILESCPESVYGLANTVVFHWNVNQDPRGIYEQTLGEAIKPPVHKASEKESIFRQWL